MKFSMKLLALAALMAAATTASAQSAGHWTIDAGINQITPKVESGDVSAPALPHTKTDVNKDSEPVAFFTYGITDNISTQIGIGLPYKHTLYGAGAIAGTGKLGTMKTLPATVFLQYRFFEPNARVRPYVGLGITYAYFFSAEGSGQLTAVTNPGGAPTTFKVDNKLCGTAQVGVAVALNEKWYVNAVATKTRLTTDTSFSTNQTLRIKLDPAAVALTVGYRF